MVVNVFISKSVLNFILNEKSKESKGSYERVFFFTTDYLNSKPKKNAAAKILKKIGKMFHLPQKSNINILLERVFFLEIYILSMELKFLLAYFFFN